MKIIPIVFLFMICVSCDVQKNKQFRLEIDKKSSDSEKDVDITLKTSEKAHHEQK